MRWNHWTRQIHRWLSAIFMLTVIFTAVALAMKTKAVWVSYVPLAPLFLLMITGTYMFFLPYFKRGERRE